MIHIRILWPLVIHLFILIFIFFLSRRNYSPGPSRSLEASRHLNYESSLYSFPYFLEYKTTTKTFMACSLPEWNSEQSMIHSTHLKVTTKWHCRASDMIIFKSNLNDSISICRSRQQNKIMTFVTYLCAAYSFGSRDSFFLLISLLRKDTVLWSVTL